MMEFLKYTYKKSPKRDIRLFRRNVGPPAKYFPPLINKFGLNRRITDNFRVTFLEFRNLLVISRNASKKGKTIPETSNEDRRFLFYSIFFVSV